MPGHQRGGIPPQSLCNAMPFPAGYNTPVGEYVEELLPPSCAFICFCFLPICGAKSISGWLQSTMPSSDVLFVQFCFHHQEHEREWQPSIGWNVGFGSPLRYDEANSASQGQACAMPSCSNGSVRAGDGKYKTSVLLRWFFISFFFPMIWDEPTPAWWELSFLYEVSTPARQSIQTWPSSSHPHCVGIFSMLWAASVGSDLLGTVS